jgi:hypothetical protein
MSLLIKIWLVYASVTMTMIGLSGYVLSNDTLAEILKKTGVPQAKAMVKSLSKF